jgi:hypothetical protein
MFTLFCVLAGLEKAIKGFRPDDRSRNIPA